MASINVPRVLAGSVAAGAVMNVCDWVINNFILADAWQRVQQARNVDVTAASGGGELVKFITVDFLLGFLIVWVYAAIRPRLGPGPGTAVIATLVIFGAGALNTATFAGWMFSWDMFFRSTLLGAVSMLAAGLTGARVYTEEEPQAEEQPSD